MISERFGRWEVLSRGEDYIYPTSGKTAKRWFCRCDCGKQNLVHGAHLRNGSSTSCGCYNREISTKHGKANTRAYSAWYRMMQRCNSPSPKDAEYYKHIRVCKRWEDFENFYAEMGDCPGKYELDRKDSMGNYEPSNCRWVSEVGQAGNRRKFKNNTSGYTGVVWSAAHNKWRVCLYHNKVKYEGGLFLNLSSAVSKRKELELAVLGHLKQQI